MSASWHTLTTLAVYLTAAPWRRTWIAVAKETACAFVKMTRLAPEVTTNPDANYKGWDQSVWEVAVGPEGMCVGSRSGVQFFTYRLLLFAHRPWSRIARLGAGGEDLYNAAQLVAQYVGTAVVFAIRFIKHTSLGHHVAVRGFAVCGSNVCATCSLK